MSNKVILVVLDGLNYQVARDCMGYLNGLLELSDLHEKQGDSLNMSTQKNKLRATLYPMQCELPTMSRPPWDRLISVIFCARIRA